ncbi:PREDICTED: marginal zone B- and B1-cell-specific protein-like [Branchiostoma belcheri]|uniref:Marginal zone B- and B1-cell-specific protein-like n=1 Tax=Branchiostoma belcheri TaxID=7741 RepID=A0A6P4Y770_BRABE|nr:PREDICTED: marginal zone B- and B1-cell-specific protein-like [Branchiostoma belcheri]
MAARLDCSVLSWHMLFVLMVLFTTCARAQQDQKIGSIKFSGPDVNSEESESMHMPDYLKCDACRIIAYKFTERLEKVTKKRTKTLSESEIIDTFEEVCEASWDDYGIKEVDGLKRLSGPGLETKEVPGVMQGGGKWPYRLKEMCYNYVGIEGEEELYDVFKSKTTLEKFLCKESNGPCHPKNKKTKKVEEEKEKEEL